MLLKILFTLAHCASGSSIMFKSNDYNLNEIIFILQSLLNVTIQLICYLLRINFDLLMHQDKQEMNKLFNFAFDNQINLNSIVWLLLKDEITSESGTKLLVHGSRSGISGPIRLDASGESNDFSDGFYCGETLLQAGMFVAEEPNSSLYMLKFNTSGLKCARFAVTDEWLLAVSYFRGTLDAFQNSRVLQRIALKVNSADYILAPIADNRMFELIDLFIRGEITNTQCKYSMSTSYLGYQYVLKTQKALNNLLVIEHCFLSDREKQSYLLQALGEIINSLGKAKFVKEKYAHDGLYINEILL